LSGVVEKACIGVHGTLTLAPGLRLKTDVLLVYADGSLLAGTASAPLTDVEIVIRDRAIDTTADPEQFGQGIIGFGRVFLYGQPATGNAARSIVIRSENPVGVRGHVLLSQRADADIRYVAFLDMGRTSAARPIDSTTFTGDAVTHLGTNQIGRYSLHMHHVMGPQPNSGRARQYVLVGNLIDRDSKWGIALHNSHFGLVQDNVCVNAIGACYVEEDGSETDNHWIGNYAGQIANPSTVGMDPVDCVLSGYDPEGRCASGFWLRGINNVLLNNIVEDARVGIGWWTRCLERNGLTPCSGDLPVTIPRFPGADTTDPAQVKNDCKNGEGLGPIPCTIMHRVGLQVDGNTIRRTKDGLEHWWTIRVQNGSVPITNTVMEGVDNPFAQFYSDVAYDGATVTRSDYRGIAFQMFNDGQPNGYGVGRNELRRATIRGYDACWRTVGQLDHPPLFTIADSICQSVKGIHIMHGGQGYGDTQDFQVRNVRFEAPPGQPLVAFTVTDRLDGAVALPTQRINTTVTRFQGGSDGFLIVTPVGLSPCTTTRSEVVGAFACPLGGTPPPPPVDCVVSAWGPWSAWVAIGATQEQRTRTRTVLTQPANGGTACPPLTETETRTIVVQPPPVNPCLVPLTLTVNRNNGWPATGSGSQLRWTTTRNGVSVDATVTFNPFTMPWTATATDKNGCSVTVAKP
jgi:hypothetical protein